ncbi:MAG: hypothetical protein J6V44_12320 [Methanobrevibacter sp.]|jgi:hypothetical protein|nr:hypothetical protein [Methanobrevibacter sp.]
MVQKINRTYGVTEFTFAENYGNGFVELTNANKILQRLFPASDLRATEVSNLDTHLRSLAQ